MDENKMGVYIVALICAGCCVYYICECIKDTCSRNDPKVVSAMKAYIIKDVAQEEDVSLTDDEVNALAESIPDDVFRLKDVKTVLKAIIAERTGKHKKL